MVYRPAPSASWRAGLERDRHRLGPHAVARDAPGGVGRVEEGHPQWRRGAHSCSAGGGMMRVHNIYCGADGESHFRDLEIELSEPRLSGLLSKPQSVGTLMFRQVPPGVFLDWHNAPQRQYAIVLDGHVQFTTSDAETRVLGAGQVLLVEDTTGKGHQGRTLEGPAFRAIFVTLPPTAAGSRQTGLQ